MFKQYGRHLLSALLLTSSLMQIPSSRADIAFQQCVDTLQKQAKQEGIPNNIINEALSNVSPVTRTIELDRKQPEFSETFANYLNKRVTRTRIQKGRELLQENKALLDKLTKKYGIPPQYLIAFWGLETNYGGYLGKFPVIDTLVTLACDHRRSTYFSNEVIAAMEVMDEFNIPRKQMVGSWAGAMGQTQFMPSAYLHYGVDGDKDHDVNLWKSIPDAMSSAANFLHGLGWHKNWRWGREVLLPKDFNYLNTGFKNKKPLSQWRKLGITTVFGGPLPDGKAEAALLIPSGHRGPAFLVYDNFDVIMSWNRSIFYSLAVGILADKINGLPDLHRPPPTDSLRLNVAQIKTLQTKLNKLGFDSGNPDGIIGSDTRGAIREYQHSKKMIADGYPDKQVFDSLNIALNK
ncbi:MAG: lytic murein transglycosylase [Endozoicomonas sp. (ex Botrylloides leachii)]|nr:lytic murein transglycosylase [Endozoicomonas sp. (ex Botrylloides leachii)]